MCFSRLRCDPDVVWFVTALRCIQSLLITLRDPSQRAPNDFFWGATGETTSLHRESVGSVSLWIGQIEQFPPQSISSSHTKGLPIGIILSFVLLTSMKLPSLVFFRSVRFLIFSCFALLRFEGRGAWLNAVRCEIVELQAKPKLAVCTPGSGRSVLGYAIQKKKNLFTVNDTDNQTCSSIALSTFKHFYRRVLQYHIYLLPPGSSSPPSPLLLLCIHHADCLLLMLACRALCLL